MLSRQTERDKSMKTYIVELLGFSTKGEDFSLGVQMGEIEVRGYDSDDAVKNLGNRSYELNGVLCDQWMVTNVREKPDIDDMSEMDFHAG
jgi:hypothetical protein